MPAYHVTPLQAVELAALVQAHRHSYGFSRAQAVQLLEVSKSELLNQAFAAAVERGKALDLAQTAQMALVWLEAHPTQDA